MTAPEPPADLLRRAVVQMLTDAKTYRPGSQDEQFRLAVAEYLGVCRLVVAIGQDTSKHSLKIARAYLGEA